LPQRIRLTINSGVGPRVLISDGQAMRSSIGTLTQRDYDLLETLVYDNPSICYWRSRRGR